MPIKSHTSTVQTTLRFLSGVVLAAAGCQHPPQPQDVLEDVQEVLGAEEPNPDADLLALDILPDEAEQPVVAVPLVSNQPGALAVVKDRAGLRVFAVGRSQELLTKTFRAGPGWTAGLAGLGHPAPFTSVAALDVPATPATPEHVLVHGSAGQLMERVWTPASGWGAFVPGGGSVTSVQVLAVGARLWSLAVGANGALMGASRVGAGAWSAFTPAVAGALPGGVSIRHLSTFTVGTQITVYAVGSNGALYVGRGPPGAFTGFTALPGYAGVVDVSAFRHPTLGVDYIITSKGNRQLWARTRTVAGVLGAATLLPGTAISVSAFAQGTTLWVYVTRPDGYIYRVVYTPAAGWVGGGNVSLAVPKPACAGYHYSPWACAAGGVSRTVVATVPAACFGGAAPVLSQGCAVQPTCPPNGPAFSTAIPTSGVIHADFNSDAIQDMAQFAPQDGQVTITHGCSGEVRHFYVGGPNWATATALNTNGSPGYEILTSYADGAATILDDTANTARHYYVPALPAVGTRIQQIADLNYAPGKEVAYIFNDGSVWIIDDAANTTRNYYVPALPPAGQYRLSSLAELNGAAGLEIAFIYDDGSVWVVDDGAHTTRNYYVPAIPPNGVRVYNLTDLNGVPGLELSFAYSTGDVWVVDDRAHTSRNYYVPAVPPGEIRVQNMIDLNGAAGIEMSFVYNDGSVWVVDDAAHTTRNYYSTIAVPFGGTRYSNVEEMNGVAGSEIFMTTKDGYAAVVDDRAHTVRRYFVGPWTNYSIAEKDGSPGLEAVFTDGSAYATWLVDRTGQVSYNH